jgi:ABC-type nickel/cobalt efflux system permease component RcnA
MRRPTWVWWFILAWFSIASIGVVSAHPLGNFTINHLTKVQSQPGRLRVHYVLDIAEIPSFQIMHASSPDAVWTTQQLQDWAASEVALVIAGLHVDVDGAHAALAVEGAGAHLRPGAGGLPTLYWSADFSARLAPGEHRVRIVDEVYGERRVGWRDIIVGSQHEPTHELTAYPNQLLGSPRRVNAVAFTVSKFGDARSAEVMLDGGSSAQGASMARTNPLVDRFASSNHAPAFVLFTVLVAFGLGALHAIEPGHGKALLAFTLVGSRATVRQAMSLAFALTFAHTIGVVLLGIALFFSTNFVSESVYPWITLLSGVAIAVIGARNLSRCAHSHHHEHHTHLVAGSAPIDFRSAIVAAMSGGIAPCPAAIVVMLAALRLHQLGFGLVLIVVFSLGLASVLTVLGIAIVQGSSLLARSGRYESLVAAGPLISATLISVFGAVVVAQGFAAQGVLAPEWIVASLVALAIAGYALSRGHTHGLRDAR